MKRLAFLLALFFVSSSAFALVPKVNEFQYFAVASCWKTTFEAAGACAITSKNSAWGPAAVVSYASNMVMTFTYRTQYNTNTSTAGVAQRSVCPANSTGTTTCTCDSGFQEVDGACEAIPVVDPSVAACALVAGTPTGSVNASMPSQPSLGWEHDTFACVDYLGIYNCAASIKWLVAFEYSPDNFIKQGTGTFTGSSCTQGTSTVPPPVQSPCPVGQTAGTVNGATYCAPSPDQNVMMPISAASSTVEGGFGVPVPAGTSSLDKTVECINNSCITTTNFYNDTGAALGSSTKTESQSAFCASTPSAPICASTGDGTPGGMSEFCAENPDSGACADGESMSEFCEVNPDSLMCSQVNGGDLTEQPLENTNVNLAIVQDSGWGAGGGSCPPPRSATVAGMTIEMPFTLLCDFAAGIRPIVIGMAWLAAALGFMGFARKD